MDTIAAAKTVLNIKRVSRFYCRFPEREDTRLIIRMDKGDHL